MDAWYPLIKDRWSCSFESIIETAFEREYGGPVEKLRPEIIARMKVAAPAIYAECHKYAAAHGHIIIMTPDETLITEVHQRTDLERLESYYRACISKNFQRAQPPKIMTAVDVKHNHLIEQILLEPLLQGAYVYDTGWSKSIEVHTGWFSITVNENTNIKKAVQACKFNKRGNFYVQKGKRRGKDQWRTCFAARGIATELLGTLGALGTLPALNNEILSVFDKLSAVTALLPQPIAEEIHAFFH